MTHWIIFPIIQTSVVPIMLERMHWFSRVVGIVVGGSFGGADLHRSFSQISRKDFTPKSVH
jgi:hypothetical protein